MKKATTTTTRQKRTGGWTTALVTFIFILVPALLIIVFLGGDYSANGKGKFGLGLEFAIAISFIAYAILLTIFLWWIQLTWIDIANFIIPVAIVMMGIFITHRMPVWSRALIVLSLIITALPVNIIIGNISDKLQN